MQNTPFSTSIPCELRSGAPCPFNSKLQQRGRIGNGSSPSTCSVRCSVLAPSCDPPKDGQKGDISVAAQICATFLSSVPVLVVTASCVDRATFLAVIGSTVYSCCINWWVVVMLSNADGKNNGCDGDDGDGDNRVEKNLHDAHDADDNDSHDVLDDDKDDIIAW